jgi:hypothetical protein
MQEVGTEYTLPTITLTPTFGEYTYGPATGVEFEAYKEENETQIAGIKVFDSQNKYTSWTNTESINTNSEEKNIYISSTEKAYMIDNPNSASSITALSCVAYYTAATSPAVDNLGNPSDPLQTIAAGKIEKPLYIKP